MSETNVLKWKKKPQVWRCDNLFERVNNCRIMLVIHGFLTDAENERVMARILRWRNSEVNDEVDSNR